jgi:hypothetical protein
MARSHPFQVNLRMSEEAYAAVEEAAIRFGLVRTDGEPNMSAMCLVLVEIALNEGDDQIEQLKRAYDLARNEAFVKVRDQFHTFLEELAREMPTND